MKTQTLRDNTGTLIACSAALATLVPVTLFQTGVLDKLPDPPGAIFNSEKITSSKDAHPLGIPDGLLGLGSYTATLALVLLARESPRGRKLLGVKLVLDGTMAGVNVVRQIVSFGKICSWCTGTAIATAAMVWAGRHAIVEAVQAGETSLEAFTATGRKPSSSKSDD